MDPPPTPAPPDPRKPVKSHVLDARVLHRKLIEAINELQATSDPVDNLERILRSLVDEPEIPVIGGRLWTRAGDEYKLVDRYGGRKEIAKDYRLAANEEVLRRVVGEGLAFIERSDPGYNRALERDLGVDDYAAIAFGDNGRYVLSLDVTTQDFDDREEIVGFLGILRHAINRRLEADHFEWVVRETADIQTSILPKEMPRYREYDIFGRSIPADRERVGGDLFDFIDVDGDNLAVVVADASGHGLPAALMARDIRTAVHMAIIGEIKPTRMIARINRIVCEQAPLGRFISLFYGEIDRLDQMIYTTAGHTGLLVRRDEVVTLREGGPVLGIHPGAAYARGVCRIDPGDIVCIFTDGINEARAGGEVFGDQRIHERLMEWRGERAKTIAERLLDEVQEYSNGIQDDDRTVVVIRRREKSERDSDD